MLNRFLENCEISATTRMAAQAQALREQGVDVIDLTVGEPDFSPPVKAAVKLGHFLQANKIAYSANKGLKSLREAVAKRLNEENGVSYSPDEIMITHGAKQAVSNAVRALVSPGDEVLIPVPYYPSYPQMVKLAGAVPVYFSTVKDRVFHLDTAALESLITERTRCLILNYPANPSGLTPGGEQLLELAALAKKYDLAVITDEIYSRIIYDGHRHPSFPALSEDTRNRTVLVNGFSKCLAMTGWRVGYSAAPAAMTDAMDIIQNQTTGNVSVASQTAALYALEYEKDLTETMRRTWSGRRDMVCDMFSAADMEFIRPGGAIYVFFKYHLGAEDLLRRAGVACVPGGGFGMPGYLRLSLTAETEKLAAAVQKIIDLL